MDPSGSQRPIQVRDLIIFRPSGRNKGGRGGVRIRETGVSGRQKVSQIQFLGVKSRPGQILYYIGVYAEEYRFCVFYSDMEKSSLSGTTALHAF